MCIRDSYKGSGVYWRRIIKKHNPQIITTILGHYKTNEELRVDGIFYSKKFNIIEDPTWANLIEEIGDGGATVKSKVRAFNLSNPKQSNFFENVDSIPQGWKRGTPGFKKTKESVQKTAQFHTGRKRSEETRQRMKNSTRKKRMTVVCEICNKNYTPQNIKRHLLLSHKKQ